MRSESQITSDQISSNRIEMIFNQFAQACPEPKGELNWTNPYTLLIAVALSAQATDIGVNKATAHLFCLVATPQQMLDLGEDRLIEMIRSIGLYRTKARNLIKAAQILVSEHGGFVPESRAALERLPGVGRKTADVVLNTAFGHPTIAVDTHVFRVAHRLDIASGSSANLVADQLAIVIPERFRRYAHHWLILHGRYTCKARRPLCDRCALVDLCSYSGKTISPDQASVLT